MIHTAENSTLEMRVIYEVSIDELLGSTLDLNIFASPAHLRFVSCQDLLVNRRLCIQELGHPSNLHYIPYSAVSYVWSGRVDSQHPKTRGSEHFTVNDGGKVVGEPV